MGREYFLAGIGGYRPDLAYSVMDDHCVATFPGHDHAVAVLPKDTVDAVFTSTGVLAYRDSRGEVNALQVPDHERAYKAAVAASQNADKSASPWKPQPFSQIMGRHTGGLVSGGGVSGGIFSSELSGHGPYRSEGAKENMEDAVNRIVIGNGACMKDGDSNDMIAKTAITDAVIDKASISNFQKTKIVGGTISADRIVSRSRDAFDTVAADLVRDYIEPLVQDVQRLTKMNTELTSKVRVMERLLERASNSPSKEQPATVPSPKDAPLREASWGDQGGLPNFCHPLDNPFCGKRRG